MRVGDVDNEGVWLPVTVVETVALAETEDEGETLGLSLIVGVGVGLVAIGQPYTFRVRVRPSQLQVASGSEISSIVFGDSAVMIEISLLSGPPALLESANSVIPLTFRVTVIPSSQL